MANVNKTDFGLEEMNETDYGLKEVNGMDYCLKEMNDNITYYVNKHGGHGIKCTG